MKDGVAGITEAPSIERVARATPALILGYFALHALLRMTAPGGLGLDEAEQLVATQSLEWGYGSQPPLYSWLQWLLFQLTGPGKLGLAVMKNGLLAVAYVGLWAAALKAGASPRVAMVASLSLLLLPPIAWEAQRALSHSVLAVALSALTVWLMLGERRRPGWGRVAALGLLLAAGVLAKGNLAYVAVGLAVALAAERASPRWLASAALAALLLAAPTLWMLQNPDVVMQSTRKFGFGEPGPGTAVAGTLALAEAVLAFAALMLIVHAALFWRRRSLTPGPQARFLWLWLGAGLAAVWLSVLATGATDVKERWLQPVLAALPLAATLAVAGGVRSRPAGLFLGIVAAIVVTVLVALPLNLRRGGDNPAYQSAPFAAAAAALPEAGLALVADDFLAGNLRLMRPELAVLTPQKPALHLPGRPGLAVWWSRDRVTGPPDPLVALVAAETGLDLAALPVQRLALSYPPPHEKRDFHLGWAVLRP